jgi:hypothetical protein
MVVSPASDQPIGSCWDRLLLGSALAGIGSCWDRLLLRSALADLEHGELSEDVMQRLIGAVNVLKTSKMSPIDQ